MPLTANQGIFCQEYGKDRNGARAYRTAYPNCHSGYNAHAARLIAKDSIKQRISRIMAELADKLDLTRDAQYKRLLGAYDMAVTQKDPRAIKSVLAEINLMLGYQREAAPNEEKEQARAARMSKEDREMAVLAALLRTEQEARAGLKLAGTG